jgi:uncharacterized protein (AIM24 family)
MEHAVRGSAMPVLEVTLSPGEMIVADPDAMSWMRGVDFDLERFRPDDEEGGGGGFGGFLKAAAKRVLSGVDFHVMRFTGGPEGGFVAFAASLPGQIVSLELDGSQQVFVRSGALIAAEDRVRLSGGLSLSMGRAYGIGYMALELSGTGITWISVGGELTRYDLGSGEMLRSEAGHLVAYDASVACDVERQENFRTRWMPDEDRQMLRVTGPGRVWLQSMSVQVLAQAIIPYLPPPPAQTHEPSYDS